MAASSEREILRLLPALRDSFAPLASLASLLGAPARVDDYGMDPDLPRRARAVLERDIEEIRPVENALDVLAQVVLSMAGTETWDIDALYARLRTSWPYRALPRAQFDLVLNMMAGRYARTRVRELRPTLAVVI